MVWSSREIHELNICTHTHSLPHCGTSPDHCPLLIQVLHKLPDMWTYDFVQLYAAYDPTVFPKTIFRPFWVSSGSGHVTSGGGREGGRKKEGEVRWC